MLPVTQRNNKVVWPTVCCFVLEPGKQGSQPQSSSACYASLGNPINCSVLPCLPTQLEKNSLRFPVKRHFTKYYHWVFGGAALWGAPQVFTLAVHDGCCFLLMFPVQDTHCRHCNSMASAGRNRKRLSPTATLSLGSLEFGSAARPCLGCLRFMTCHDCHLWNSVRWKSWPGIAQEHLDQRTKTSGLNFFGFGMENLREF